MGVFGRIVNLGRGMLRGATRSGEDRVHEEALRRELAGTRRAVPAGVPGDDEPPPRDERDGRLAALRRDLDEGRITEHDYLLRRAAVLDGRDPDAEPGEVKRTL